MKVYLDDERKAPKGWIQTRWPEDTIELLKTGQVTHLSLDHDLGDDERGTGYDVLKWLEKQVWMGKIVAPNIGIHTSNPGAVIRMLQAVRSIEKFNGGMAER